MSQFKKPIQWLTMDALCNGFLLPSTVWTKLQKSPAIVVSNTSQNVVYQALNCLILPERKTFTA